MKDQANDAEPGEFPGDFRNGIIDFGWDSFDEETKLTKRAIELNQGCAAQRSFMGPYGPRTSSFTIFSS